MYEQSDSNGSIDNKEDQIGSVSRRTALKAVGTGALSLGLFSSSVTAKSHCTLDACTERFLLEVPLVPALTEPQWDGETIAHNKPLIKVGAELTVEVDGETISAPFAFDPIVTCVQAGTTVRWEWLNQTTVSPKIPETVHHNVDIFQYSDDCTYMENSFVTSGTPEGFHPPHEPDPVSFEHTFDEPGVYPFYCEPHGYPALPGLPHEATDDAIHGDERIPPNIFGMRGAVIVTEKRGRGRR